MDVLTAEICRALLRHWSDLRAGRAMPARGDIDPLTLPRHTLPHLFLVEVGAAPDGTRHFTYRIVGTAINAMAGRDVTGQEIGPAIYGVHADEVLKPFRRVAETGRPLGVRLHAVRGDEILETESVFLPLGQGTQPTHILAAVARRDGSGRSFSQIDAERLSLTTFAVEA